MNLPKLALGLSALFTFITLNTARAATQLVLQGTSDAFSGTLDLNVITDNEGKIDQIETVSPTGTLDHDISQLGDGIILYTSQGHNVLTIKSADFDVAHGGAVEVDYLVNGINGSYDHLNIDVQYDGTNWQALTDDAAHTVVTKVFFKANKFFGQTIGISSITFSP